jgi:hypothetical protein
MSTNVITTGEGTETYVELASRPGVKQKGRLFRKQILHFGSFKNPNDPSKDVVIDEEFAKKLEANFSAGMCDIVQAPIVNDSNKHVEDPLRNIGEIVDVDHDANGIYAYLDARKNADDLGNTLIGASAMMSMDYTDTRTGKRVGPTLLHMAVTNRPYITNLAGFEEVIAASADTSEEQTVLLGAADNEEIDMPKTLEELFAALKTEHNIDVEDLQKRAGEKDEIAALSNVLGGDETLSLSDIAEAVVELSNENKVLVETVNELKADKDAMRLSAATVEIDGYVAAGRILPKQRDAMLELSMSNRETFEALLPEESLIDLSESGTQVHEETHGDESQKEIDRLLALAKK